MPTWLSAPGTPAWVQAIGSIIAILVAVGVPAWQHSRSLRDTRIDRARQEKEHLSRLVAALRAEVSAALEAADRQLFAAEHTLAGIQQARERGAVVVGGGPIRPGSMLVTDAIVYREIAAELGRLPSELVGSLVMFYALALELGRIADGASTAQIAYQTIRDLAPRLKMHAALLISTLDKFQASGFVANAEIRPKPEEVRVLAAKLGYPLEQIMKERGIQP